MVQENETNVARGLNGIYIDKTESSHVDGEAGKLLYRGYNIHDLADKSTFEETTYLLWHGKLPNRRELDDFASCLAHWRSMPEGMIDVLRAVKAGHPMDVLRTAVSAMGCLDPEANDPSPEANLNKASRLTAQFPTIVAAHHRMREGKDPVPPDPDLGHAANFLWMLRGTMPDADDARAMDVDMILHADHGSNASAFAARVTASTRSDLYSAIVSALGTLKGPLHGGAAEAIMTMVREIGEPERVEQYVNARIASGGRIMGFGHRVYKNEDPRAPHMRDRSRILAGKYDQYKSYYILRKVDEVMAPYRQRGIYVNVDFYAAAVYYLLGIPEELFIPIFAIGRIPGWIVQVFEQWQDNVLIRPLLEYVGPIDLPYVPMEERP
jgi:citrate synthase